MRVAIAILSLLSVLLCAAVRPSQAAPAARYYPLEWHLRVLGAPAGWAQGADGHGESVLVIDTGLDKSVYSSVLAGNVLPSISYVKLSPHTDAIGHGTWCSVAIAGHGSLYVGVAPKAKVAMARVFGTADAADVSDIAAAIRWGTAHRFRIISLSLGSQYPDIGTAAAIKDAQAAGVLIVAAAGNDGLDEASYPSSYPGVIRVTATDYWDRPTPWSNWGYGVGVAAPGDYVFGYMPFGQNAIGVAGAATISGTSMATPLVAGVLADLLSLGLSTSQAKQALYGGATTWHKQNKAFYGHGVANLPGAIAFARFKGWL